MIINRIYDYQPIERIATEQGRKYLVEGSTPLPSVTTILSKNKDMTFLDNWKARIGINEATRITNESSTLGTGLHANLENYILGKPISGTFMEQALANVIIKKAFPKVDEIWGTEVALYSKDLYAGTTDAVGIHEGIPSIIDFKNSIREKKKEWIEDYFMQVCAYSIAHNEMFGTNIHRGVIMIATRDAKYQEFIIEGDEFSHYEMMWANKLCAYYDACKLN